MPSWQGEKSCVLCSLSWAAAVYVELCFQQVFVLPPRRSLCILPAWLPQDLPQLSSAVTAVLHTQVPRLSTDQYSVFAGTEATRHFPAGGQWQQSHHRSNRAKNHQEQVGTGSLSPGSVTYNSIQSVWGLINGTRWGEKVLSKGIESANLSFLFHGLGRL